jgi:hypothetical protein
MEVERRRVSRRNLGSDTLANDNDPKSAAASRKMIAGSVNNVF